MKAQNFKAFCIAMVAVLFLTVSTQAQDKMSKMSKDTSKMKMDHKKSDKKMKKMSKMKKDTTKM